MAASGTAWPCIIDGGRQLRHRLVQRQAGQVVAEPVGQNLQRGDRIGELASAAIFALASASLRPMTG